MRLGLGEELGGGKVAEGLVGADGIVIAPELCQGLLAGGQSGGSSLVRQRPREGAVQPFDFPLRLRMAHPLE